MRELSGLPPEGWARSRTVRLAELAERQAGVVHRTQLEQLGISGTTISRWLAERRIVRLYRGVYAVGTAALRDEGRLLAALLYAGERAALSHLTAAWWWRLIEREPPIVHVAAPGDVASTGNLVVHHPREIEVVRHRGLAVATVPHALLGMAGQVSLDRVRRALAEAEFRGVASIAEVESVLGRGRRGSAALRRAIALHRPELALTRSVLEERFLALCERHGIPIPQVNVLVEGFLVDAFWPAHGVIVELDGHAAHATAARRERDHARDLALRAAGFIVRRYTWAQVTRQSALVAADLRAALSLELSGVAPGRRA